MEQHDVSDRHPVSLLRYIIKGHNEISKPNAENGRKYDETCNFTIDDEEHGAGASPSDEGDVLADTPVPYMPDHVGMRRNDSSRQMQFLREGGGKLERDEVWEARWPVYNLLRRVKCDYLSDGQMSKSFDQHWQLSITVCKG